MDIQKLTTLVYESTILNDSDRAYWLSQLPTMTQPQLEKLEGILSAAANIPMEKDVHDYFTLVRQKNAATQTAV